MYGESHGFPICRKDLRPDTALHMLHTKQPLPPTHWPMPQILLARTLFFVKACGLESSLLSLLEPSTPHPSVLTLPLNYSILQFCCEAISPGAPSGLPPPELHGGFTCFLLVVWAV